MLYYGIDYLILVWFIICAFIPYGWDWSCDRDGVREKRESKLASTIHFERPVPFTLFLILFQTQQL